MKCDELKAEPMIINEDYMALYYPKGSVDASIAELKRENERLVKCCKEYDSRQRIDERIIFNGAQQLRATKRALWLARAERAFAERRRYCAMAAFEKIENDALRIKWCKIQHECIKKAEEYK